MRSADTGAAVIVALVLALGACGAGDTPPERAVPDENLTELPVPDPPPPLTEAVEETRAAILDAAERGSLSRLSRFARTQEGFVSNFGNSNHFRHWDLLRRTGVDPNRQLRELFETPYGVRKVGEETWYVWPDLAALDPDELLPERLSFRDRARLRTLVGESGIEAIREGRSFPGVRTAIASDGRWVYFLQDANETEEN